MFAHPEHALNWTIYKPLFCQHYDIASIPHTFIHKVTQLTLASCNNSLQKYHRKICETMAGAKERFTNPDVTFPVANAHFADADRAAHTEFVNASMLGNTNQIFNFLTVKAFINGLPQNDYDRLKNKVQITTATQMLDYLVKDSALKQAATNRAAPAAAAAMAPVEEGDITLDISAVKPANPRQN